MAYDTTNLSVVGYANGFTLWHYATSDALNDVQSAGHFDAAHRLLRPGDQMTLHTDDGYALAFITRADEQGVALQVIGAARPIKQDAAA